LAALALLHGRITASAQAELMRHRRAPSIRIEVWLH
jgi:hypothetical protein